MIRSMHATGQLQGGTACPTCPSNRSRHPTQLGAPKRSRATARAQPARCSADRGYSGLDIEGNRPTTPRAWEIVSQTLKRERVQFLSPSQLQRQAAAGTRPVLDVRPSNEYEKGFIEGSVNVPLYRPITGWDARKNIRRLGFALFGVMNGTEVNPNFMEEVMGAAPDKAAGAILVCNLGGTLEATEELKTGQQSRSLFAAYELIKAGYENVAVLDGGYFGWTREGRDIMAYE